MKNRRIVLINSFGPMGSTPCAAIVEKFGYINIPLRKLGLNEYLMGIRDKHDPYMIDRFSVIINSHGALRHQGGVSVFERDNKRPIKLINSSKAKTGLKKINKSRTNSVCDLYFLLRNIYSESVIYKQTNPKNKHKQIELTTDIRKYDPNILYKKYCEEFEDVKVINLKRDFMGWLNSYSSQWFKKKYFDSPMKLMSLNKIKSDYDDYISKIESWPGLQLDFDELFLPKTPETIKKISTYLKEAIPSLDWKNEKYDLYGRLEDYLTTYTKFDDKINHLSSFNKKIISLSLNNLKITKPLEIFLSIFFISDYFTHKMRNRKILEKYTL
jgi:hypothetical protein